MLVPYWIECADAPGVGITARSEADALSLFEVAFGHERQASHVKPVHEASELDQCDVIPNMGNWLRRGIWYPLGYETVAEF
jgi:hypothetical protein